jgi:uncharacterized tellurite resistance protein B-like protein
MRAKNQLIAITLLSLAGQTDSLASAAEDEHIRQIVQSVLKEKDQKIEQLEARIKQLESEQKPLVAQAPPSTSSEPPHPEN